MYPFSKNKASFRIADILHQHQQTADSQLLAHHLMLKSGEPPNKSSKSQQSNEIKNSNDLSSSKSTSPAPDASPDHHAQKGGSNGDMPMKPTPMYSNFPLGFPLGIHPAFHPAAYLNYADAIHKGETRC
jgi:hypothetical protein